uniref:Uncharacterized protein n=1 Tax=Glycine max TaxID=3847 RepID=C6TFK3_SOYBN|nr:unknown [Glycine max]
MKNYDCLPVDHVENEYCLQLIYFSTSPTTINAWHINAPKIFKRAFPGVKIKCRQKRNKTR